jgi:hypothetical protein
MTVLKNSIVSRIKLQLESDRFCAEDFALSLPDNSPRLVYIEFRANTKYSFTISEAVSGELAIARFAGFSKNDPDAKSFFQTLEKPGDYKNTENKNFKTIDQCIDRIRSWMTNLHEDLTIRASNDGGDLNDFTEALRKQFEEKSIENPDEHFTITESENLKSKLDELSARVTQLEKQCKLEKKDIAPLEVAIKNSRDNIDSYPRNVWYKTSGNKILSALKKISKTKEVREFLLDAAKKFLLGE